MNRHKLVALLSDLLIIVGLVACAAALYLGFGVTALLAFCGATLVTAGGLVAGRLGRQA